MRLEKLFKLDFDSGERKRNVNRREGVPKACYSREIYIYRSAEKILKSKNCVSFGKG